MSTAPLEDDIWICGLARVFAGSSPFTWKGQASWHDEMQRWEGCAYTDQGDVLVVAPAGWMPLPKPVWISIHLGRELEAKL